LIAAQAVNRGMVLVTANTDEFSRVEHLMLENWEPAKS
jgi:predicted nucleic acid-binding protein